MLAIDSHRTKRHSPAARADHLASDAAALSSLGRGGVEFGTHLRRGGGVKVERPQRSEDEGP
jgi:hypothetical protein